MTAQSIYLPADRQRPRCSGITSLLHADGALHKSRPVKNGRMRRYLRLSDGTRWKALRVSFGVLPAKATRGKKKKRLEKKIEKKSLKDHLAWFGRR